MEGRRVFFSCDGSLGFSSLSLAPFGSGQWNGLGIGRCRGHLEDLVGKTRDKTQGMFWGLGARDVHVLFCLLVSFVCWMSDVLDLYVSWIYVHMNKVFKEMLYLFCLACTCILHTTRKALSHLMWLNLFIPYHTWTDLASGPHTARNLWIAKFLILRHHQVLLLLIPVVFQFRQLGMINVSFQTMSLFTRHLNCKA